MRAFANLKLVIELDFGWNNLHYVPIPQMRSMRLLRKLTMRGNRNLKVLNETTLSGGLGLFGGSGGGVGGRVGGAGADNLPPPSSAASLVRAGARALWETFPDLAAKLAGALALVANPDADADAHSDASTSDGMETGVDEADVDEADAYGDGKHNGDADEAAGSGAGKRAAAEWSRLGRELNRLLSDEADNDAAVATADDNEPAAEIGATDSAAAGPDAAAAAASNLASERRPSARLYSFAANFVHLQELDFGQCELHYVKWTAFEGLSSLKRLWLDGNKLR